MALIYFLLLLLMFNRNVRVSISTTTNDTVNIAAILNVNTAAGRAAQWSLQFALEHLNHTINGSRLNLTIQESGGDVLNVLQVFRSELVAILVQDLMILKFVATVAEPVDIPVLSFSGANGFGSDNGSHTYDDMEAIAAMVDYFQWKEVNLLYQDEEFWLSGVYALSEALQERGKRVSQTAALPSISEGDQVRKSLLQLNNTSCIRAFIVYSSVDVAVNLFSVADGLGMMTESYAWLVTDSIASSLDSLNSSSLNTMQGIVGVKRIPTPQFTEMRQSLQLNSSDDGINRVGIEAYSSLMLVAKAVSNLVLQGTKVGYNGDMPNNVTDFPASMKVLTGGKLLREEINSLKSSSVNGNGEISEYEIINIVGGRCYRRVGLWEKDKGLLQSGGKQGNTLSPIIWPGDITQAPNGYRKLVVGKDMRTSASNLSEFLGRLSGYTSDTFETAVKAVPYNLPFVYEAFNKDNISSFSGYDPLVTELFDGKKFDAVVGDATILWNRSLYVDFTQPYRQTVMVMMVRIKRVRGTAWLYLHPFNAGLWAVVGVFFIFTAFLVWLTEHHNNEEFNGGITEQIVTSLTLSLSTFVFPQREDVKSVLGKGVVALWLFIALILHNSYTAHLTSILTVEKLAATLTNMNTLAGSNVKVGFMNNSYARNFLMEDLKIPKDRLVSLRNPQDYVQKLLSGEVGAIVEESLYVEILKSLYPCAMFTVVDRAYFDTGGLGFFFRKGSPFVSEISQAILNISEQYAVVEAINNKWFGEIASCPDMETGIESNRTPISLLNVWTLFVLTASMYVIIALIYIGRKQHQRIFSRPAL